MMTLDVLPDPGEPVEPADQGGRPPARPGRTRIDRPDPGRWRPRAPSGAGSRRRRRGGVRCEPLLAGEDARAALDALRDRRVAGDDHDRSGVRQDRIRRSGRRAHRDRPSADADLDDLALPGEPLLVVVEGVEKPGNVGAILRSADGAGVDALIAASPRTDLANPNVIRASAGTIFAVPMAAAPTRRRHRLAARAAASASWPPASMQSRLHRADLTGPARHRPGHRDAGPDRRLARRRRRGGAPPDARRRRQPQRLGRRRRSCCTRRDGNATAIRRRQTEPMSTSFDFVVIGAGPGGEAAAHKARELGATVAIADAGSAAVARTSVACHRRRCSTARPSTREPAAPTSGRGHRLVATT